MYAVANQTRWSDALRSSHVRSAKATLTDLVTGTQTPLTIEDGSVTDDATSTTRRTLSLTVPPQQAVWDALDTVGAEITVTQWVQYVDGTRQNVPMGVFVLETDEIDYTPGGTISLNGCPDRWGKVAANTMPLSQRASIPSNTAWQEIKRLVEGAWPNSAYPFPGWSQLDTTATTKVGAVVYDGDRAQAISDLCIANAVEMFFDRNGLAVLRPVPQLTSTSPPQWTIDAGERGVLLTATRQRDRSLIRNVILVTTSASDVTFPPVEVKNTTTGDPLSVNGPLGYRSEDYSSPLLRNSAQATAAGKTRLNKTLGVGKQIDLESTGNPALDSGDVVTVMLPQIDANTPRPAELHILDTISHPLSTGSQTLSTRSTRPSTDAA